MDENPEKNENPYLNNDDTSEEVRCGNSYEKDFTNANNELLIKYELLWIGKIIYISLLYICLIWGRQTETNKQIETERKRERKNDRKKKKWCVGTPTPT